MGLSRHPHEISNQSEPPVKPLLELRQLSKHFPIRGGVFQRQVGLIKTLDRLNLAVQPGETVTLVGGHGAGKTMLGRLIMQLVAPTAGHILFDGEALARMGRASLRRARQQLQLILQDPYAALNPKMMVSDILAEPLQIHKLADGRSQKIRVAELLQLVGLNPYMAGRYPHEFSGGQRQRINIARALATGPRLLVVDDPLVALDTAVRPQIISLLAELKQSLNLTLLLLVSDLTHVRAISDRVGVLYMGEIVELAETEQVYERPLHPYTQFILSQSAGTVYDDDDHIQPMQLTGPATDPANPPSGCRFRTQCPYATDVCREEIPPLRDLGQPGDPHLAACHHAERFAD